MKPPQKIIKNGRTYRIISGPWLFEEEKELLAHMKSFGTIPIIECHVKQKGRYIYRDEAGWKEDPETTKYNKWRENNIEKLQNSHRGSAAYVLTVS